MNQLTATILEQEHTIREKSAQLRDIMKAQQESDHCQKDFELNLC